MAMVGFHLDNVHCTDFPVIEKNTSRPTALYHQQPLQDESREASPSSEELPAAQEALKPCAFAVLCDNEVHLNDHEWKDSLAGGGKMEKLAEFASLQMEFKTLSHHTGDPKYAKRADNMIETFDKVHPNAVSHTTVCRRSYVSLHGRSKLKQS